MIGKKYHIFSMKIFQRTTKPQNSADKSIKVIKDRSVINNQQRNLTKDQ